MNPWGGRFGGPRGAGRGFTPWGGGRGRVWGGGRGFGRFGWGYPPPAFPPAYGFEEPPAERQLEFLRTQADMLEKEIEAVRKRIEELEGKAKTQQ